MGGWAGREITLSTAWMLILSRCNTAWTKLSDQGFLTIHSLFVKRRRKERERKKEGEGLSLAPGEPSTLCVAARLCSATGLARGRAWRLQPGRLQLSFYALFLCMSAQQRSKCGCKAKQMSICCSAFLVIWWITTQPQRWICSMRFSPQSRLLHPRRCTTAVLGGRCSKCGCWQHAGSPLPVRCWCVRCGCPHCPSSLAADPLSSALKCAQATCLAGAGGPKTAKGPDAACAMGGFAC